MPFDPLLVGLAGLSSAAAVLVVTRRNPVYSAVWLLICFVSFALLYLKLAAPFLAAIHVIVYTGAILVLFVFVIMLLNLRPDEFGEEYPVNVRAAAAAACTVVFAGLAWPILTDPALQAPVPAPPEGYGGVEQVGELLFRTYALPFELVSVLIVVAMFGAMVLAKKDFGAAESGLPSRTPPTTGGGGSPLGEQKPASGGGE